MPTIKHPAVFSDSILDVIADILIKYDINTVFDPMAGTGKIALVKDRGWQGRVICNEIEPEWATLHPEYPVDEWHVGDAARMGWCEDGSVECIATSPVYGNRMSDHFNAKDSSKRITYRHSIGRELNEENTGRMNWGMSYIDKESEIIYNLLCKLSPTGLFILNVSDHIRDGEVVHVSGWHVNEFALHSMILVDHYRVETPRMKFGANSHLRVDHESVFVFKTTWGKK